MGGSDTFSRTLKNGLWDNNPGLVQLLGLCPLLAVTSSFVNGLGLGLATLFVVTLSNVFVSLLRRFVRDEIRIPMYVLVIATLVTCIELVFKAYFPSLDRSLGIFIPLIVTNCTIVARAEIVASRNPVGPSLLDGLAMGTGFLLLLCALGAFREVIGHGSILSRMDLLVGGPSLDGLQLVDGGFLLALLPPGAFIALGLAVAAKNYLDEKRGRSDRFALRHSLERT